MNDGIFLGNCGLVLLDFFLDIELNKVFGRFIEKEEIGIYYLLIVIIYRLRIVFGC